MVASRRQWAVLAGLMGSALLLGCESRSDGGIAQVKSGGMILSGGTPVSTGGGPPASATGGMEQPQSGSQPTSGGVAQPVSGGMTGSGGVVTGGFATGGTDMPGASGGTVSTGDYDHVGEVVALTNDLVVPAGQTLRVGPGTTFESSANVTIRVQGTLIVEGAPDDRVRFVGNGTPRSWPGIVVESGGRVEMTDFEVVDANYGIHAKPGSGYTIDAGEFGNSFKAMVLQADGAVRNSQIHATDGFGFALVNEVSIEGVNGTLTIIEASPTVSNSTFDGGSTLVDMIRVGGNSAPTFDHLYITNAHCGIHANGADSPGITIRNTIFEGMSYGLMLYTSAPTIENSVFLNNSADYGFCFGATAQHVPMLSGNYYSDTAPLVDPSCFQIGVDEPTPATTRNPNAGPQGL